MKAPKTMGELRSQLAQMMVDANNGTLDEKRGRLAINAATRIIESFQAECRSRLISAQLKEASDKMGETRLD